MPSEGKEFLRNYLDNIAGTVTAGLGLVDILNTIKENNAPLVEFGRHICLRSRHEVIVV